MNRKRLPKYVSEFRDRHGKWRVRFRRTGQGDYYFRSVPWSPEFMQEYQACINKENAPAIAIGEARNVHGTFGWLIAMYLISPEFLRLKQSTQFVQRSSYDRFRQKHGTKRIGTIERQHIKAIIGGMHTTPHAADNLLDLIKKLMAFAVDMGIRRDNPAIGIRGFNKQTDGIHTWTEGEIAKFREHWPIGSKQRLAMELALNTAQRKSDVVEMGWQHVSADGIAVVQRKTGTRLLIPLTDDLLVVLKNTPRDNLTFLVTEFGKPFTAAGFGNWFRDCCNQAGLPQCSLHGLRKAAARRLAESGKSNQQIKAMTGHKTDYEVARYTAAADQKLLARQALGMESEQKVSNLNGRLDNPPHKSLKRKDT